MKKLAVFLSILSISAGLWAELNTDEIIFYEEFSPLKDEKKIEQFSNYYQSLVDKNEPETLGWKFFKAEDKVIAILRWKNSDAIVKHLENVSEGGILEEDFQAFNEHFAINSISVYGNVDQEVKAMLMDFGLPFEFNPLIAGYSR
tara:strand:- start:8 stop:442 length:435 start_codon:yes stop_codon:yes gene_type:complete